MEYKRMEYKRRCAVCRKLHDRYERCPIVEEKIKKYDTFSKKNFLMGNILLECIKKDVDFGQLLREIAELNEEDYECFVIENSNRIVYLEGMLEYFAVSLDCSSMKFTKDFKKTVEEYVELMEVELMGGELLCEDDGSVVGVEMEVSLKNYYLENNAFFPRWSGFRLRRESVGRKKYQYSLVFAFDHRLEVERVSNDKSKYVSSKIYNWSNLSGHSWNEIILVSESNGKLARFFEENLKWMWQDDDLIRKYGYESEKFDSWMKKLESATANGLIEWKHWKQYYSSTYRDSDVEIWSNEDSSKGNSKLIDIREDDGLGIRLGYEKFPDNYERDLTKENQRINTLVKMIDDSIVRKKQLLNYREAPLTSKKLNYKDVIVIAKSMICYHSKHTVIPYKGIVELLNKENKKINYEIYVGYCVECQKYYVFKDDYYKMIEEGRPLCAIYWEDELKKKAKSESFFCKSQSVLNAMGYNVKADSSLQVKERQQILVDAVNSGMFEFNDLLNFLNWLIQTRMPQQKYENAVKKWKEDLEFIKRYNSDKRNAVEIKRINI